MTQPTTDEVRALHAQINDLSANNQRLAGTLREARDQIVLLKEEVERLASPPNGYAIFEGPGPDGHVVVTVGGRKMRVTVSPDIDREALQPGQDVILNEANNVVVAADFEEHGELAVFKEMLDDGRRALVITRG